MPRYELPPDLTPREERLAIAAIERMLELDRPSASPWTLAGRAEALRLGRLQLRRHAASGWSQRGTAPFVAGGTWAARGRGDAR